MTTTKDIAAFRKAYGSVQMLCELVSKMAGEDGKAEELKPADVEKLKRLTREAACSATAISASHDGRRA